MIINIGLDFGTSATKVAFYNLTLDKHYFYVFDKQQHDLSRYCLPSIVRLTGNKIYFDKGPGHIIELFKINMENKVYEAIRPYFTRNIKGYFLVALYCAFVLKKVKKYLSQKYPEVKIIIQCGIPIDHLIPDKLTRCEQLKEEKFRFAFSIADKLSDTKLLHPGCKLELILEELEKIEKKYIPETVKKRKTEIYPETIAGIASLLNDQTLPTRHRYSIIDIGAGTTDISFFEYHHRDLEGKFSIYSSQTLNIGADNYSTLKTAKEMIKEEFRKGFYKSYSLCHEKWNSNFQLLYLGGGSRGELKKSLKGVDTLVVPGNGIMKNIIDPIEIKLPRPIAYDCADEKNDTWKKYFDILALSYGLSFPNAFMPPYNPQVEEMAPEVLSSWPSEPITPDVG